MSTRRQPVDSRVSDPSHPLRICLAYDRLYPWSIGGAERWYRLLAERLASDGHRVTYLTTRQWEENDRPRIPSVHVIAIVRDQDLYTHARRRITPLLRFGLALWRHLLLHGRDYDVVHGSGMSAWSAMAAGSLAGRHGFRLVLDWWEVWTWDYWRRYLGRVAGSVGWLLQRQSAKMTHQPVAYSELHANRLRKLRQKRTVPILQLHGLVAQSRAIAAPDRADPVVVYFGRHIAEKQVPAIVPAVARAREKLPKLRATLFGNGPETPAVRHAVQNAGLEPYIELPGFVKEAALFDSLGRALCLIVLSRREGYGLVVAEAAALGVPSIVLSHVDSAAAELIAEGVNGFTCASTDADEIASAILRVHEAGYELRLSTLAWFNANAGRLTIEGSLPRLLAAYRGQAAEGRLGA